jgi:hypothetical protein
VADFCQSGDIAFEGWRSVSRIMSTDIHYVRSETAATHAHNN